MEERLKKLLKDLQGKEKLRKIVIEEIESGLESFKWRQETEEERFAGERDKDGNWLKKGGIYDDINAGVYNNTTEGQMQKIINEELGKIKAKYDIRRAELNKRLEETKKLYDKERENDYKQISPAIKDYHLIMVLAVNRANKELMDIDNERNTKIQEVDKKIAEKEAERNAKIQELDKMIAEKEAMKTHLIIQNRNFMDIEANMKSGEIRALGEDIERLKFQKESISTEEIDQLKLEKDNISNEYALKLKAQSEKVEYYSQQKERAGKFLGSIKLSEKSIDEVYEILFGEEKLVEQSQEEPQPEQETEQKETQQQNQETEQKEDTQPDQETEQKETLKPNQEKENKEVQQPNQETRPKEVSQPKKVLQPDDVIEPNKRTKKELINFSVEVTKNGSRLGIMRDGDNDLQIGDWHETYETGQHFENVVFELENKAILQSARNVGDKFVVNEIVLAVKNKSITYDEGKNLLNNYLEMFKGNEITDSQFELTYDLRGLSRSELDKEQKEYIIQKAKEARRFEKTANVKVKPGFFRGIGWRLEEIGTKLNLWNKNKALPEGTQSKVIVTSDMVEKMSEKDIEEKKQTIKERLKVTGKITENQQLNQGLNKALKEQDEIKRNIEEEGR